MSEQPSDLHFFQSFESQYFDEEAQKKAEINSHKIEKEYQKVKREVSTEIRHETIDIEKNDVLSILRKRRELEDITNHVCIPYMETISKFLKGEITTIMGNTNSGKSSILGHIACHMLKSNNKSKIALLSLEDTVEKVVPLVYSQYLEVTLKDFINNGDGYFPKVEHLQERVLILDQNSKIDKVAKNANLKNAKNAIILMNYLLDNGYDTFMIDYYQMLSPEREGLISFISDLVTLVKRPEKPRIILFSQCKQVSDDEWDTYDYVKLFNAEAQNISQQSSHILRIVKNDKRFSTKIVVEKSKISNIPVKSYFVMGFDKDNNKFCSIDDSSFIQRRENWMTETLGNNDEDFQRKEKSLTEGLSIDLF